MSSREPSDIQKTIQKLQKKRDEALDELQKLNKKIEQNQHLADKKQAQDRQQDRKKAAADRIRKQDLGEILERAYGSAVPYSKQKLWEEESGQKLLYQVLHTGDPQQILEQLKLGLLMRFWLKKWIQEFFMGEKEPTVSEILSWLKDSTVTLFFCLALYQAWEERMKNDEKISGFREVSLQLLAGNALEKACKKRFEKEDIDWMESEQGIFLLQQFYDQNWFR